MMVWKPQKNPGSPQKNYYVQPTRKITAKSAPNFLKII